MVIARRTFEAVGPFREEFFIDCVDVDFFLRAARAGLMTVVGAGCEIEHELGELSRRCRAAPASRTTDRSAGTS